MTALLDPRVDRLAKLCGLFNPSGVGRLQIPKQKSRRERKVEDRRLDHNNGDVYPFISIAEAVAIALSKTLSAEKLMEDGDA
jgi:hypothetical protein